MAAGPELFLLSSTVNECASILKPLAGASVNSIAGNVVAKTVVAGKFFEDKPVGQAAPPVAGEALLTRVRPAAEAFTATVAGLPEVLSV